MKPVNKTFQRLMLATALVLAGMLGVAGAVSAAPSEAPNLVSTPSNPHTSSVNTEFEYTVGDGETSVASPLRFYCRTYPTATPPAANSGWSACGLSTDSQPVKKVYAGLANGDTTFQVAARESSSISTQGPIASFSWTQSLSPPSGAPNLTGMPENPSRVHTNGFEYGPPELEAELVDRYQYRLDSSEESDWQTANTNGNMGLIPGNGEHTVEFRAGNASGYGPATEAFTWTVDVPNPHPNAPLSEVASPVWTGAAAASRIGKMQGQQGLLRSMVTLGDVNGDGLRELVIGSNGGTDKGIYITFGKASVTKSQPLSALGASEGYKIATPSSSNSQGVAYDNVGDQNGDGTDDLVVRTLPTVFGAVRVFVVYSVADPLDLPLCSGSTQVRCLNLDTLTDEQGYELKSAATSGFRPGAQGATSAGDFDGDGIEDLLILAGTVTDASAYIVRGGARTGVSVIDTLPATDMLRIDGPEGSNFGVIGNAVGDLNGDNRQDIAISANDLGLTYVFYGFDWEESPTSTNEFSAQDGILVYGAALVESSLENVGDLNGDNRPDLAAHSRQTAIGSRVNPVSLLYNPIPESNVLVGGGDILPETGYVLYEGETGLPSFGETLDSIGDLNNDGIPDQVISASDTTINGHASAGAAFVVFGQPDPDPQFLAAGPELTPSLGVALTGREINNNREVSSVASMGDLDGDGLTDFVVGWESYNHDVLTNVGQISIIYGKRIMNQVSTKAASGVSNSGAILNGNVDTNGRDTEVWFEYGTDDTYGEVSNATTVDASIGTDLASTTIDDLTKDTTYHYRAVARNELGLIRYGDDQTFTTTNVAPEPPVETCDLDPTGPGCAQYCKVNPTAMGCPDYDWCANNPGKCNSGGGPAPARLTVISITKKIAVKRGKRGTVQLAVINTGGKAAKGVKVCVKAPKRLVKVKRCTRVGSLGSGASRTVKIKVKAKRKRGKAVLRLTANGNNVSAKKTRARVVVR